MAPLLHVGDEDALTTALAAVLHRWTTTERTRQLGRYELFLEARRRPDLARTVHLGGTAVRHAVAAVLAELGAPEPEQRAAWLVAGIEGLLHERLVGARADETVEPDTFVAPVRWLVHAALT